MESGMEIRNLKNLSTVTTRVTGVWMGVARGSGPENVGAATNGVKIISETKSMMIISATPVGAIVGGCGADIFDRFV
jgi:hypothetical protein